MFGTSRIKIDKALRARAKRCADLAGYSSVDEFIVHIVEREVARVEQARLCRCGASNNKPFCDGSHVRVGFRS